MWKVLIAVIVSCSLCACDSGSSGNSTDADTDDDDGGVDGGDDDTFDYGPWSDQVDEFWGPAPPLEDRIEMFEILWGYVAKHHAGFVTSPVDWDEVYLYTRPRIEAAESYGRFYQLMAKMFVDIADGHTSIDSVNKVCRRNDVEYMESRPPLYSESYSVTSTHPSGACVAMTEDDEILVYKVDPENPAGLQIGDRIAGYDGVSWGDLLDQIDSWHLPHCGSISAAPYSNKYRRMTSATHNFHLFSQLDVLKAGTGEAVSVSTEEMLGFESDIICTDQLPVVGVEMPWSSIDDVDLDDVSNGTTWGLVEGTNVGYIYVNSYCSGSEGLFNQAVADLMGTEGLIVDNRFNHGGWAYYFDGLAMLATGGAEAHLRAWERAGPGDYYEMVRKPEWELDVIADPATSYDYPVAILQGPQTASAGEGSSFLLHEIHHVARSFGESTKGAFGYVHTLLDPEEDTYCGDISLVYTSAINTDSGDNQLNSVDNQPDEEVWFNAEDVVAGIDPVVGAALEWIDQAKTID